MSDKKLGAVHNKDKIFLGYVNTDTNQLENIQEATSDVINAVVSWFLDHQQATITAPDPTTRKLRVVSCLTEREHDFVGCYWGYVGSEDDRDVRR
jgi:hypothetical protein